MPVRLDIRPGQVFTEIPDGDVTPIGRDQAPLSLSAHAWQTMNAAPHLFGTSWWTVGTFKIGDTRHTLACRYVHWQGDGTLHFALRKD